MKRTEQQWNRLQEQVKKLRKQNQDLKRLLQIEVHREPFQQFKRQHQSHKTYKDNHLDPEYNKNVNELKKQWAEWSNRLEASIVSKNNKVRHQTQMQDLRKTTNFSCGSYGNEGFFARKSLQSMKSGNSQQMINLEIKSPGKSQVMEQKLSLIEDIFLFGPSIMDIESAQQRKFIANHQLYFPQNQKPDFQVYGNYLFPNQLQVKHIRQKNHGVQINKMIFKNNKKLDCNIFIFQGQTSNEKLNKPNKILDKVNPSKWLYALSIQFSDFVSARNQNIPASMINRTLSNLTDFTDKSQRYVDNDNIKVRDQDLGGTSSKKNIKIQEQIFKSNFCLCIMTYFPFIRFLKDVLIDVFDSVKLRRMNKYSTSTSNKQIDIYFFIQELKIQLDKFLNEKLKVSPQLNQVYSFQINEVQMKLDLKQNNLVNEILSDWAFKILKLVDKESLLDIFCYLMMEESICFLAQDRTVLTFIILLYIVVFTLPFGYPHPCVSIVFNDQLLETPFTAVLGINKGTKWLEENIQTLTQNKQNKIIVNLNQDQIKIKFKKKPRTHKSQKLKKIFTSFYRKIQTSAIPSLFKKKMQLIYRQTTKQQNENVFQLFSQLQNYYQEQMLNHLPNRQIIDLMKQTVLNNEAQSETNPNYLYNFLIEKIEKFMGQSRKAKNNKENKDPFIDELIKKQLFRVYIDRMYQLN